MVLYACLTALHPPQPILWSFEGLLSGRIMIKTLPRVDFEDFHASLYPSTTVQNPDEKLAEENKELLFRCPTFSQGFARSAPSSLHLGMTVNPAEISDVTL